MCLIVNMPSLNAQCNLNESLSPLAQAWQWMRVASGVQIAYEVDAESSTRAGSTAGSQKAFAVSW